MQSRDKTRSEALLQRSDENRQQAQSVATSCLTCGRRRDGASLAGRTVHFGEAAGRALKLIRNGIYDAAVARRFASEQQSLAIMEHPAIAKVFDAGSTTGGQPYFVMEYVPGPPITRYCDQKKLEIRERLELFIRVCEGVQHAHQKAIIHRDLKPSNILVTEIDGKPEPRIVDFGRRAAGLGSALVDPRGSTAGHARLHESGAGRSCSRRCGHAHRRVFAGRGAV
jgi:serine/threonine protein kinase